MISSDQDLAVYANCMNVGAETLLHSVLLTFSSTTDSWQQP